MTYCQNCGTQITCGCQERVASNGTKVCASCITAYEQQLTGSVQPQPQTLDENFTSQ